MPQSLVEQQKKSEKDTIAEIKIEEYIHTLCPSFKVIEVKITFNLIEVIMPKGIPFGSLMEMVKRCFQSELNHVIQIKAEHGRLVLVLAKAMFPTLF